MAWHAEKQSGIRCRRCKPCKKVDVERINTLSGTRTRKLALRISESSNSSSPASMPPSSTFASTSAAAISPRLRVRSAGLSANISVNSANSSVMPISTTPSLASSQAINSRAPGLSACRVTSNCTISGMTMRAPSSGRPAWLAPSACRYRTGSRPSSRPPTPGIKMQSGRSLDHYAGIGLTATRLISVSSRTAGGLMRSAVSIRPRSSRLHHRKG